MKIEVTLLSEPSRTFELNGRIGWAMAHLTTAGAKGVTTIDRPAPRWSAYVHNLRELGIEIDTVMEPHHGNYPGQHARYRLACDARVKFLSGEMGQ